MFSAAIYLCVLAIPLVASHTPSISPLASVQELGIIMNESALANKTALKGLEFWKTDPGATCPGAMTIDPRPGYTFGDGLDQAT